MAGRPLGAAAGVAVADVKIRSKARQAARVAAVGAEDGQILPLQRGKEAPVRIGDGAKNQRCFVSHRRISFALS